MSDDRDAALELPVGPELTIAQAAETHALWAAALADVVGPVRVPLQAVSEFDSAGVQLLLALKRSQAERGQPLELLQPSEVVLAALRCYALEDSLLGSPETATEDAEDSSHGPQ